MIPRTVGAVILAGLVSANALAQAPAFELASVKLNKSSAPGQTIAPQGDRFLARNVTVHELIATAYQVPFEQISGGPVWIDSERYDVEAKAASAAPWPEMLRMLQTLLAERFSLRLQRESREIAAYDLIAMPSGHRLKPAPPCEDGDKRCGGCRTAPGSAIGRHTTMPQLAALLSGRAGRRVTDATGVQGNFDIELRWNPGPAQLVPAKPGAGPADAPPIDPSAPTLSVAIEEQLGLRFRSSKGTTEYLTIVSIERAREN